MDIREFLIFGLAIFSCLGFIALSIKFLIQVLREKKKLKDLKKIDKILPILTSEKNYFEKK